MKKEKKIEKIGWHKTCVWLEPTSHRSFKIELFKRGESFSAIIRKYILNQLELWKKEGK